MLSNTVSLTILFILGVSLLTMILNRRTRARCLQDFDGFLTTVSDKNGKRLYGILAVSTTGLEFCYRDNHLDKDGHIETSSILYRQEFNTVWVFLRFHDDLSPENQVRRQRQLQRSFHPSFYRRIARGTRNLMVNLKDAFTDIMSTFCHLSAHLPLRQRS